MAFTLTGSGFGTPAVTFAANHYHTAIEGAANDSAAVTILNAATPGKWSGITGTKGTRTTTSPPAGAPITRALICDKIAAEGESNEFPVSYDFGSTIGTAYFTWLCRINLNGITPIHASQWKPFRLNHLLGSVTDGHAPNTLYRQLLQTADWSDQFTVHQSSSTANSPTDLETHDDNNAIPGTDIFYCTPDAWHRVEFWFKESSGLDAADGYFRFCITKLSDGSVKTYEVTDVPMYTSYLDVSSQSRRYQSFTFQNWLGNGAYSGLVNIQVYLADIYFQRGTRGTVYLGDAATWAGCTIKVPQPVTAWSNTEITGEYHPGELITEDDNYLYVMLDNGSMHNTSGIPVSAAVLPSLSSVYANLTVTKGATVTTGTYDWGVSHWTGADSVTITGAPDTFNDDPEDPIGTWPNIDRTYLIKAVATNVAGASTPAYFTVQVGEGSAIATGTSPGGILGRVIR